MERSVALAWILITVLMVAGCSSPEQRTIIGSWGGSTDLDRDVVMTFNSGGEVSISVGGNLGSGTYQVDLSRTPAHLDIVWEGIGEVRTIFRFLDDDRLQMADSDPGHPRPEAFDEDAVVLTRER